MTAINALKQAARTGDAKCAGRAVDQLRGQGFNYNDCFKLAKAGNPSLTLEDWECLMMEADSNG